MPTERIYELGMKDNFWQMGDTGPCGPCSELHYDMGPAASDAGHTDCQFGCECGRYVEIWNLVFMQFDKQPSGELIPLPKPSIDTGAGLERVTAVLQGVISNYDTDLFVPLIKRAAELTGVSVNEEMKREDVEEQHHQAASLRVIADHARAATFLISDGVLPMNEGRGYVLRKIIRRAIRHGRLLGQEKPFLFEMVYAVRDLMKDAYPELIETSNRVAETIKGEETRFAHTLDMGLSRLEELVNRVEKRSGDCREALQMTDSARTPRDPRTSATTEESRLSDDWMRRTPWRAKRSSSTTLLDCHATSLRTRARDRGISFDAGRLRRCHGRAAPSRAGFMEGRREGYRQPGLSVAAAH